MFFSKQFLKSLISRKDSDPGQTQVTKSRIFTCQKHTVHTKEQKPFWMTGNQAYLLILVNFQTPGSGSGTAKSVRIQIHNTVKKEQDTDPYPSRLHAGSWSGAQWFRVLKMGFLKKPDHFLWINLPKYSLFIYFTFLFILSSKKRSTPDRCILQLSYL